MDQISVCNKYIKERFSHFTEELPWVFKFVENNEEKELIIVEEKEGKLFDENFHLILSETEQKYNPDYFAFCFGGQFYYIKSKDLDNPKIHILRYLGQYEVDNSDFVHLGIHSTYSLLQGCQKIETYVEKAKYLNMKALGICEKHTLNSCIKFQDTCKNNGIKPIIGEEIKVKIDDIYNFKLYVKNKEGWQNLINISNIINVFQKQEEKDYILFADLCDYLKGLIVILPNNFPFDKFAFKLKKFDCYYQIDTIEFLNQNHYFEYLTNIKEYLNSEWSIKYPPVLISDSYYLDEEDKYLQDVVKKIGDIKEFEFASVSQHFKSIEEHIEIFSKFWKGKDEEFDEFFGTAIENTCKIADKCDFEIKFEKLHIPDAIIDEEDKNIVSNQSGEIIKTNLDFFEQLIRNRMNKLGFSGIDKYEERVKEEYDVIVGAGLEEYFLIIWDILNWCKKNNILTGLSRGSAAGSFIMYLMDIVKINPFDYDLLFSRFLNAGRVAQVYEQLEFEDGSKTEFESRLNIPNGGDRILAKYHKGDKIGEKKIINKYIEYKGHISLPDVDMDVEDRKKVKQYIIKKYGEEQFSLLGSYNTFKIKAAIKDLCRVMGTSMDYAALNVMTSTMFFKEGVDANFEEIFRTALTNSMFYNFVQENPKIVNAMYWLLDTPKSASVHPCGTLLIPKDESIFNDFPLSLQEGEYMCEWTGPELDTMGFVKNDLLGLAQLGFIKNILTLIKEHRGENVNIYNIPLDDKEVYKYLSNGWNSEVFQFNSNLLVNYCKVLNPTHIGDLSVAVAAVRPGPMNNGLHLKYVKRKEGREKIDYHFGYKDYTEETYGIILFQEQVIRIASYLGNLNLVEGDGLRKALGKKKMSEMLKFHDKIKPHAIEKGCTDKEFEEIWDEWVEFAKYAFNKSHSVAYAITGYISQYLKVHYPQEFWTAAFQKANDSSERKERMNQYFKELQEQNSPIKVVAPEINIASNKTTFKDNNIYLPLNNIKYLSDNGVEEIIKERHDNGDFYSFEEFLSRLGKEKKLDKREFQNLILSGVFDEIEGIEFPKDRKVLIQKLYKFFKKDYIREFVTDKFQENDLWWQLKQMELIGIDSIDFRKLTNRYFEKYRFFTSYPKDELEDQNANFGGIILDITEKKTKKKGQYFGIINLVCNNVPYDLLVFDDWEDYKDDFFKYKGQVVLFEGVFKRNKNTDELQLQLLTDNEIPMFIGSDETTKIEKREAISFKKGDYVKLESGKIGKIIKYPSNDAISIQIEGTNEVEIHSKWDFIEIVTK